MSDAKARRPREIKPPSWSLTVSGKDDEHPALGTSRTGARKPPPPTSARRGNREGDITSGPRVGDLRELPRRSVCEALPDEWR